MTVDEQILARARKQDRRAVEQVLAESYPRIFRLACALTGDAKIAGRVVRAVLRRACRVIPGWRKGITPENWFFHHTLLTAREASPANPSHDALVDGAGASDPEYVAFVRALRSLPRQQMEAFLIHEGERFNERLLGVAMDCSTSAAATHLNAATAALQSLAPMHFQRLVAELRQAYSALTPPAAKITAMVRQEVGRAVWARRVRRLIRRVILLALLAGAALAVWHWHALLLHWFELARQRATSEPT